MKTWIAYLAAALSIASAACGAPQAMRGRFDAYGEYQPDRKPQPTAADREVKVLYGTAPAGFSMRDQTLTLEPGYQHRILGTVRIEWTDEVSCTEDTSGLHTRDRPVAKRDVMGALRAAARVQGTNAVIYALSELPDEPDLRESCALIRKHQGDLGHGWAVVLDNAAVPAAPATPSAPAAP